MGFSESEVIQMLRAADDALDNLTSTNFDACDDYCSANTVVNKFGSWKGGLHEAGIKSNVEKCPNCGDFYESMANHWGHSCDYPDIPGDKWDLMVGLLLGDASVAGADYDETNHPNLRVYSSNETFLEWLDDELGVFSTGVYLNDTGKDRLKRNQKSGWDTREEAEYKDMYRVQTRSMPCFRDLREWYDDGQKSFPKDLSLNRLRAKMWYVSDGGLNWDRGDNAAYAAIASVNEGKNPRVLKSLFEEQGFNPTFTHPRLRFNGETEKFLDWLGEPVPGFEYKWETENRDRYDRLYTQAYDT